MRKLILLLATSLILCEAIAQVQYVITTKEFYTADASRNSHLTSSIEVDIIATFNWEKNELLLINRESDRDETYKIRDLIMRKTFFYDHDGHKYSFTAYNAIDPENKRCIMHIVVYQDLPTICIRIDYLPSKTSFQFVGNIIR